jgi:hypothetical protein
MIRSIRRIQGFKKVVEEEKTSRVVHPLIHELPP